MPECIEKKKLLKAIEESEPDVMADYGEYYGSEWGISRGKLYEIIANLPTLTPPNEWVSVEKGFPELPDASWCSRSVIVCDKDGDVAPLLWARAQVRGKTVERWKYHWGRIYDGPEITHWTPLPAPPGKGNNVPTKAQNEPLTIKQLREMDGEPVWVEDVKHWALIDIEKGGQWDGVPFAIWAENGMKFTYNIKNRGLHCYRRPPEGEEDT